MLAFSEIFIKPFSYLFPVNILRDTSACNNVLEIQWLNGKKVLHSENANYSFGSLHKVFQFAFKQFSPLVDRQSNVLILGFGAGSVYHILRNEYDFKGKITGVEKDSKVVEWAYQHFNLPQDDKKLKIFIEDASKFVQYNSEKYNLIVVDVYKDLIIPPKIMTADFFLNLYNKLLKPKGQIIFNVVSNYNNAQFLINNPAFDKVEVKTITINQINNQIIQIRKTNNYENF